MTAHARIIHKNRNPGPTGKATPTPERWREPPTGPFTADDLYELADMIDHLELVIADNWATLRNNPEMVAMVETWDVQAEILSLHCIRWRTANELMGDLPIIEQELGRPRPTGAYTVNAGTFVYVAHDRHGRPLYVGVTDDLFGRMASHRRGAPWWDQMARLTWEEWHDRPLALNKERTLIRRYRPPFNIAGNPDAKEKR